MKSANSLIILLIVGAFWGCQKPNNRLVPSSLSSRDILEKCISFHDPQGVWPSFKGEVQLTSNSIYTDSLDEEVCFGINNADQSMYYKNGVRKVHLFYTPEDCTKLDSAGSCEGYEWASRFYPFIWGLPMKLTDPGVTFSEVIGDTIILNRPCYILHTSYEKENWSFFIDKFNFSLNGFKFIFKTDPTKGEIIINQGLSDMGGIITPTKRTWFDLNHQEIGTDFFDGIEEFKELKHAE